MFGENMSRSKVIYKLNWNLYMVARMSYPWLKNIPTIWHKASKGNPSNSSVAFFIRDSKGNILYAKTRVIPNTTSLIAKQNAIEEGLEYYVHNNLFFSNNRNRFLNHEKVTDRRVRSTLKYMHGS